MNVKEKLVELLGRVQQMGVIYKENQMDERYPTIEQIRNTEVAARLIAYGVTVQEWISASEPPKKITNKVIVLCKNGYRGYGHYEDYKGERTWYNLESGKPFTDWDLEDCESYEVTHWMPMPQPPKGE